MDFHQLGSHLVRILELASNRTEKFVFFSEFFGVNVADYKVGGISLVKSALTHHCWLCVWVSTVVD
jgi:hypothetical protein